MKPTGFLYTGEYAKDAIKVLFIEPKGKDVSFPRWRFSLYYDKYLAATHFEYSEEGANNFLAKNNHKCFSEHDFDKWSKS